MCINSFTTQEEFHCQICGTECEIEQDGNDDDSDDRPATPDRFSPPKRSPAGAKRLSPGSARKKPTKEGPKPNPLLSSMHVRVLIMVIHDNLGSPDDEATARQIAYASVMGGAAAAATLAATAAARKATDAEATKLAAEAAQAHASDRSTGEGDEVTDDRGDAEASAAGGLALRVSDTDEFHWCCPQCEERFSIRTGSFFEASSLPLQRLVFMIYCFSTNVRVHRAAAAAAALVPPRRVTPRACSGNRCRGRWRRC